MIPLLRLCLGLVITAGLGSAVGIPITLHTREKRVESPRISHGGGRLGLVSIDLCRSPRTRLDTSINFGSEGEEKICWTTESNGHELSDLEGYTTLFQNQWASKGKSWIKGEGKWTQSCLEESDPWSTIGSAVGVNYLGLCSSSKLEKTKFVKRQQESILIGNDESWTFWICSRDCWAPNEETLLGAPKMIKEKEGENDNWKKVVFYRDWKN